MCIGKLGVCDGHGLRDEWERGREEGLYDHRGVIVMFVVGGVATFKIVDFYADDISQAKLWTFTRTTLREHH
jgi:hypothetical protein